MTTFELAKSIKLSYLKSPVLTPDLFNRVIDLILRSINTSGGGGGGGTTITSMTPEEIRDALSTLQNEHRLNASSIHDLAENVIFTNPDNQQTVNVIQMVDYLLELIKHHEIEPGEDSDIKFLNEQGNYVYIDWSVIQNRITKTSQLINDGEDGTSRYITIDDIPVIVDKLSIDTGIVSGMELSNAGTLIMVTPGSFAINNYETKIVDLINVNEIIINLNSFDLTKSSATLFIDKNQKIIIKYSEPDNSDRRTNALLGYVEFTSTSFTFVKSIRPNLTSTLHQLYDVMYSIGNHSISGNAISSESGLTIQKTAGTYFGPGLNSTNQQDPNKLFIGNQHSPILTYIGNGFREVVHMSSDILTTFLMVDFALAPMQVDKFSFTKFSLSINQKWYAELFDLQYDSIEEAKDNIGSLMSTLNRSTILQSFYIVYKYGITNISESEAIHEAEILDENGQTINMRISYDAVINALGYVPENEANKVETLENANHTTYPTTLAVVEGVKSIIDSRINHEKHDFSNVTNFNINHALVPPVKAFVYVNNKEVLTTVTYDQINKMVTIYMTKPKTGYVLVESLA